jgi:hypothetical protein
LDVDLFGFQVYLDINLDIMTECTTRHTAMGWNDCPLRQLSTPNQSIYQLQGGTSIVLVYIAPRTDIPLALSRADDPSRVNPMRIICQEQAVLPENSISNCYEHRVALSGLPCMILLRRGSKQFSH